MTDGSGDPRAAFWRSLGDEVRFSPQRCAQFRIADRTVAVHLAEDGWRDLLAPLAHLHPAPDGLHNAADLEIFAWTTPRASDWQRLAKQFNGALLAPTSSSPHDAVRVHYDPQHRLLCVFDPRHRRAAYVAPSAECLPFWEWAAPFRLLLHWWAETFGGMLAHAAAVGSHGQGLLLVGRGGSGKSTTAIACFEAGMDFISDDYTLLTLEPHPVAHALYSSAKLRTEFMRRALPHWASRVARQVGPEGKSVFLLHRWAPQRLCQRLSLCAVCLPQVTDAPRAAMRPLPRRDALLALAPSSLFQLPGTHGQALAQLRRIIQPLPALALLLGRDIASGPSALARQLAASNSASASHAA